jgi:hypothetical protein
MVHSYKALEAEREHESALPKDCSSQTCSGSEEIAIQAVVQLTTASTQYRDPTKKKKTAKSIGNIHSHSDEQY